MFFIIFEVFYINMLQYTGSKVIFRCIQGCEQYLCDFQ